MARVKRDELQAFSDGAALLGAGICAIIGLAWAVAGKDQGIAFHGWMLLAASCMAGIYLLMRFIGKAPSPEETGYADGVIRAGVIATVFWGIAGFLVGDIIAWQLAFPGAQSRSALDQLRAPAPAAHLGRDLRLRRQRADRHLLLCRAAHQPRAARRALVALVRVLGLSALHRARGDRLSPRRHPVEGICRARMVRRSLADHRLGGLFPRLRRHARQAPRAAYLCGELVLSRLHRHRRHAAHRQQSGGAGLAARLQELHRLFRRAGRHDAVVVRP